MQIYLNIKVLKQRKGGDIRETLKIAILNDDFTEVCSGNFTCNIINKSLFSI